MLSWLWRKNRGPSTIRARRSGYRPQVEVLEDRWLPSGGVLDPTFGSAGVLSTSVGSNNISAALAVATYPNEGTANDGKVVAAGSAVVSLKGSTADDDFAIVRYNLNGSPDPTFGSTGRVLTDLGSAVERAEDVAVQADGNIVAAGYSGSQLALVRYNGDGSLDASFGGTGKIRGNVSKQSTDAAFRIAIQADGKIVVAGSTTPRGASNVDLFMERYNANGTLDTSFGTGGKVTTHFAEPLSSLASGQGIDLAIDPGTSPLDPNAGKIVVVSQLQGGPVVVARYKTNGSLDTGFSGGAGYVTSSALYLPAVAIQSDDRIVVSAEATAGPGFAVALARFNADGTPDATFGSGGLVVTPLANNALFPDAVTIQPDGRIVVAGAQQNTPANSDTGNFVLVRYNSPDGSLDTSFGNRGIAVSSGVAVYARYQVAVALEPDGRIVVAGSTITSAGDFNFALARFLAAGPQIRSFTASPNPATAGSDPTLTASNMSDANPGASIIQVAFYQDRNSDGALEPGTDTLLGYATQTSPGTWTFTLSTTGLASGTYTLFAVAEDSYGEFGDPVTSTEQVL
jgi:uncharacterized delta-60 repeat protein